MRTGGLTNMKQFRQIVSLLLAVILLIPCSLAEGTPAGIVGQGLYGDCPWTVDTSGRLMLGDGKGEYTLGVHFVSRPAHTFDIGYSPWHEYFDEIREVTVLPGVHANSNSTGLFAHLRNVEKIDYAALDVSDVETVSFLFYGCKKLKTVDLSPLSGLKPDHMTGLFAECESLTEADLSGFDTSGTDYMAYLFYDCKSLPRVDVSMLDTSNATWMDYMFFGCESLTELDLSHFSTSKVWTAYSMFGDCPNLKQIDLSAFDFSGLSDHCSLDYVLERCVSEVILPDGTVWTPEGTPEPLPEPETTAAPEPAAETGRPGIPAIALQSIPAYGVNSPVTGTVYMEDGSDFDPTLYRIALYLQVNEGGTYWVKPYFDHPYTEIDENGYFSVKYATGGRDLEAVSLHVMLVPGDFLPDSDYNRTRRKALDYLLVTRDENGGIRVRRSH